MKFEISEKLLNFIANFEGFHQMKYICPGKKETIGYGHVLQKGESFEKITKAEALEILKKDINNAIRYVKNNVINHNLTENQYIALTSFVFNIGENAFVNSTLLKKINSYKTDDIMEEFKKWNKSQGIELKGLTRRRLEEARLYIKDLPKDKYTICQG